jgi:VIT1/CCC1 family predicted Fe2+/Mn2+ transporter
MTTGKRPMGTRGTMGMLRTFWKSEIIADHLYQFIANRYNDADQKNAIVKIGKMERGHATVWNNVAHQTYNVSFQISIFLKFEIFLMKLLSLIIPFTIFIHYMEHKERSAILEYSELLQIYKDNEKIKKQIANIIREEIGHEWLMMEQIADKSSYVAKAKEAIHGMTAGIIETLALVIGLLAVHATSLIIGLTGLISTIGGMVAIMTISYISAKGHQDLYEGRVKELSIKKDIHPTTLKQELENALLENGIGRKMVSDMMNVIRDDTQIVSNLIKSIKITEEAIVPIEAVKTTITFFIIGTIPIILPFFVGIMWNAEPLVPAMIAFAFAIIIVSIAGLFIAVLSGKKISVKVIHNVLIIVVSCASTYLIGLAARVLFGIESGH